jgi:hypothetical protein
MGEVRERSLVAIRRELAARLRARRGELEEAMIARLSAMPALVDEEDADYAVCLRTALSAGIEDAAHGIEVGEPWRGSWPPGAADYVRRVARRGIGLDIALRRLAAFESLLTEFLMEEAAGVPTDAQRSILRTRGIHFDRLLALFAEEYRREEERLESSTEHGRAESIKQLLHGAPATGHELGYELDDWHLGMIVTGPQVGRVVRGLEDRMGCPSLSVSIDEYVTWVWLGGRRRLAANDLERPWKLLRAKEVSLAVGEPGPGIEGWRLTHQQARAAQWVALRRPGALTRYTGDLLLAAALKDSVLARSLRETFLIPLSTAGDGALERATLRAYFDAGCNAATAAAALGVDRHTVQRRLRRIEQRLERWIPECRAELELALRLEELDQAREPDARGFATDAA